ncbi:hypothetical protein P153DRAFT_107512 [Dothidotthia symphoricarpi CBS 119687]|uniref:CWH43-like N-terminal domain-containing protein n=1 Tax=Dothidotthia symphoricarpi CBS 119687 TaxID=1392245 RepID=A0A6A6AQE5_9PLEO|nr:uncharacterized protein P153DRAFT_107512 [Dothidotthia symphoricarpi CBS 119687]KAF2134222.1 hypothetical protein P153DRAFT_107512 [Dothidotthia symphoricarpi CBS 119687]
MLGISYWVVPIISGVVWGAMLITMLVYWATTGKPHYVTMSEGQNIPYISDIGADTLKPMFIAMSAVTVVAFDLAFLFERYLRHTGKLAANTSHWQKIYSLCATLAAIAGAAGLILLTIFDCKNHNRLHNIFLCVFIGGYIISAIFICWEYQRLGIHYREHSVLRYSFWIKLFFIIAEIALVVAFGSMSKLNHWNTAAVLEWLISFVYVAFVLSFFIDFLPVIRTKNTQSYQTEMQAAEEGGSTQNLGYNAADSQQYYRGQPTNAIPLANGHGNHHANSHSNGHTDIYVPHVGDVNPQNGHVHGNGHHAHNNGYTNGNAGYPKPTDQAPLASRNF